MEEKIELKEKKPRSEKQIEAFKKAQEIRKESLKIKRDKIKEIKDLKPTDVLTPTTEDIPVKEPVKQVNALPKEVESDSEEVVYVKKKKPKKKKIIIESDSSSDEEVVHLRKPKVNYETKTIIKPQENKEIIYRFI